MQLLEVSKIILVEQPIVCLSLQKIDTMEVELPNAWCMLRQAPE